MPYADPNSPEARASRKKASRKHYRANREKEIARATEYNKKNMDTILRKNAERRAKVTPKNKVLWVNARNRAKEYGLPFDILPEDIVVPLVCPILGLRLCINNEHAKDNSPSIDRIIPEKGYVKGNIMIVSHKANTMKSNATLAELEQLVSYLKRIL